MLFSVFVFVKSLGYISMIRFTGKFQLVTQQWVGPFTRIWGKTPRVNAVGSPTHPTFLSILVQIFSRLTLLRSCISAIRKPTHLLWVLQKI
jgi:hypothetical protein